MSMKSLAITAAIGLAALAGGVGAANAGGMGKGMSMGKSMSMDHHNFFHHGPALRIVVGSTYSDCSYFYNQWLYTGDVYWKQKFNLCKAGL